MTLLHEPATADRAALVGLVERLLLDRPPVATDEVTFLAARFDAGLAWVDFPVGHGGLSLPVTWQEDVEDRLAAAGAPRPELRNLIGVQMVAPTVLAYGTEAQQAAWLRPAFVGEQIWCQLFSEPGAGSDLASLATRAERRGDGWAITGQKVWTTLAHLADWAICLARTDGTVAKHAGLTLFAVDMRTPGVDVRPLRQISGEAEYNEVFLDDVVVPDGQRIGEVGNGWRVAMHTLMSERGVVTSMSKGAAMDGLVRRLLAAWEAADPSRRTNTWRERVVDLWMESCVVRWSAERDLPASMHKVAYGELAQRTTELCLDLQGPAGTLIDDYTQTQPSTFTHVGGQGDDDLHPAKAFLAAQALTIAGGTTNVNKNVLAERVLGLPPEPRSAP